MNLTFPADDGEDDKKKKTNNFSSSSSDSDSDDGEDSREMTGRIYTKAGIEVTFVLPFNRKLLSSFHFLSSSSLVGQSVTRPVLW